MGFVLICGCGDHLQNHVRSLAHTRTHTQKQCRRCVAQPEAICLSEWLLTPSSFRQTASQDKAVFLSLRLRTKKCQGVVSYGAPYDNTSILLMTQSPRVRIRILMSKELQKKPFLRPLASVTSVITGSVRAVSPAVLTLYSTLVNMWLIINRCLCLISCNTHVLLWACSI